MKKRYFLLVFYALLLGVASVSKVYAAYPAAGSDLFDPSKVTIDWIIRPEPDFFPATGPTTIQRGDPYDPGDGHQTIDIEIVSMELTGISPLLGPVTVRVGRSFGLPPSTGTIRQQTPGVDFPADSFFDVFFEINTQELPPMSTLHNNDLVRIITVISSIPQWGAVYASGAVDVPIYDEQNAEVGSLNEFVLELPAEPPTGIPEFPEVTIITYAALGVTVLYLYTRKRRKQSAPKSVMRLNR